jgi:hypothetical protein
MNESADARYVRANRHLRALLEAAKALAKQNPLSDALVPLAEMATVALDASETSRRTGRKPRRWTYQLMMTAFAAAVTALAKEHGSVERAIADVATRNGLNRKDLKNFRTRLLQCRADGVLIDHYKEWSAVLKATPTADMMQIISILGGRTY